MEDNGRELDPNPVNTPPVKDGYPSSKQLTIMLVGSVGKMRSFKISRRLIKYALIFFLLYIISSLLLLYFYQDLYNRHKTQSNTLQNLKSELSDKTKALERSNLRIKVLEDSRKGIDKESDSKTVQKKTPEKSRPKEKSSSKKKSKAAVTKRPEKKSAKTEAAPKKAPEPVRSKEVVPSKTKRQEPIQKEQEEKVVNTDKTRKEAREKPTPKENARSETKSQETIQKKPEEKTADTETASDVVTEPGSSKEDDSIETKSQETTQKEPEEKIADTDTANDVVTEPGSSKEDVSSETKKQEATPEEAVTGTMSVRDITFKRTDSELTLNFKLANRLAEEKTAEGYIHIIVMNKDKECPSAWNNSYNKLSNGFPVNFNHGQQFIIQNFRPYQRKYKTNPDSELPSFIRIIVYDRSGQKILEKEFPVTDDSENDPS